MTTTTSAPPGPVTAPARLAELRAQVEQFYADHFHLLDAGHAEEWARTFTPDGVFHLPSRPQPARGREALAAGVAAAYAGQRARGEQHRHWHGMVSVREQVDGSLAVRCYAQVIVTPAGGPTRLDLSCACDDRFEQHEGAWLIAERRVTRDDVAAVGA